MAPTSTTKHLKTGDDLPPLKPGVLRIYSMKFCPFAERSRLVLNAKNIPHEVVNVSTWKKPTWFVTKNPLQKVPVLEQDDKVLYESLVVSRYVEEIYPNQTPLMSKDPYQRAKDDIILSYVDEKVVPAFYKKNDEVFKECLKYLDEDLKKRGTEFFFGSRPGYLDYMLWPIFVRVRYSDVLGKGNGVPASFENLSGWVSRMYDDDAVKSTIHPDSAFEEFAKNYRTDNTLFDEIDTPN